MSETEAGMLSLLSKFGAACLLMILLALFWKLLSPPPGGPKEP